MINSGSKRSMEIKKIRKSRLCDTYIMPIRFTGAANLKKPYSGTVLWSKLINY